MGDRTTPGHAYIILRYGPFFRRRRRRRRNRSRVFIGFPLSTGPPSISIRDRRRRWRDGYLRGRSVRMYNRNEIRPYPCVINHVVAIVSCLVFSFSFAFLFLIPDEAIRMRWFYIITMYLFIFSPVSPRSRV